jgi:hypothetical protein
LIASDPGQNIAALFLPCFIAVDQIGSPPHHRGSLAVADDIVNFAGPMERSSMALPTMPWWSGSRPVV